MLEFKHFKCIVDPDVDYIEVDTSELRNKSNCIYIEMVGKNGVVCLSRENAKELADYILTRIKETE